MSLRLDTHALLWLCEGNRRLGVRALAAIREGAYVSAIVTWGDRHQVGAREAASRRPGIVSGRPTADPAMQAYDVTLLDATR